MKNNFTESFSDEKLQHWKYIKKIGNRYFYTWEELRAYYNDQSTKSNPVSKSTSSYRAKVKGFGDRVKSNANQSKEYFQSAYQYGQRFISKYSKSASNHVKRTLAEANEIANEGKNWIESQYNNTQDQVSESIKTGEQWLKNNFSLNAVGSRPSTIRGLQKNESKIYKYLAKIEINGKTRYFYSQSELDAYNKRSKYYASEPNFMHQLNKSRSPYTSQEDAIMVNPNYNPDDTDNRYEYNCAECTAIYELRRRGYDVESNGVSNVDGVSGIKEKAKSFTDSLKYNTDLRYKLLWEEAEVQKVPPTDNRLDTYDAILAEIKKNPPGSRGDLSFSWKDGGGHSVAWEYDNDKNIHIIDTQLSGSGSYNEYNLRGLCRDIDNSGKISSLGGSNTRIVRTDNLNPKKDVLNICQNTDDSKRNTPTNNKVTSRVEFYENGAYTHNYLYELTDQEKATWYPVLNKEKR